MRVFINDYEFNSEANRVYIDSITGLDIPPIRSSKGMRSGQSGGYYGAQFYSPRPISIVGHIFANTVPAARQKSREVQEVLSVLFPDQLTVRIVDDDGTAYILYCQLEDFDMPIDKQLFKYKYKLELEAPDSVIYDDTAGSELTALINQVIAGGMQFTSTSPQFTVSTYFSAGSPNATIDNPSSVEVYPVVTITGKTTDPVITNVTTGASFQLVGYAVPDGSVTVIDMQAHTVTLNGGNAFAYVSLTSEWISLISGNNEINFTSATPSDVQTAVMTWRPGLRGI